MKLILNSNILSLILYSPPPPRLLLPTKTNAISAACYQQNPLSHSGKDGSSITSASVSYTLATLTAQISISYPSPLFLPQLAPNDTHNRSYNSPVHLEHLKDLSGWPFRIWNCGHLSLTHVRSCPLCEEIRGMCVWRWCQSTSGD